MILNDEIKRPSETAKEKSRRRAKEKVRDQLQEESRTASHKLNRKIFFSLLLETGRCTCCRCNKPLTEDTYSIDHMENWLDSARPRDLFYDIKNIDFSCKLCNSKYNRGAFVKGGGRGLQEVKTWTTRKPLIHGHEVKTTILFKIVNIFKRV